MTLGDHSVNSYALFSQHTMRLPSIMIPSVNCVHAFRLRIILHSICCHSFDCHKTQAFYNTYNIKMLRNVTPISRNWHSYCIAYGIDRSFRIDVL